MLPGAAIALPLAVLPGFGLFVYVIARPSRRNLGVLAVSATIGLVAISANAVYMASPGCTRDALCGLNIANGAIGQVFAFFALKLGAVIVDRPPKRKC